jgi:hypothetical protein
MSRVPERNLTDCTEVNLLVARRLLSMQLAIDKSELKNLWTSLDKFSTP